MQGEVEFAQFFNLLDHGQYMIGNRCTLPHLDVKNDVTSLVLLNIVRNTKRISQHLKHFLWLSLFKFLAELVVHGGPHDATNYGAIIEPLQIRVSDYTSGVESRLLRCRICNHIQDPFMLQDNLRGLVVLRGAGARRGGCSNWGVVWVEVGGWS